jgi:arabinofuranosyltransferase
MKTSRETNIPEQKNYRILLIALLTLLVVLLVRRAWICDDAYITFRTVDNLIHGYRLTWNVTERVQVFTHPLWMFMLSGLYFMTRELHITTLVISIGLSAAALVLLVRRLALSQAVAGLAVAIFALSKAFMDYSTSGLENPLSHLLIVIFFILYFSGTLDARRLLWLSLVSSLGILNRMDLLLVFAPALLAAALKVNLQGPGSGWSRFLRTLRILILGQLPFIIWELFSIWYYGFPFPNTAYAKLNTGIPQLEYIQQGLLYLLNSIQFDPLTLTALAFALVASIRYKDQAAWVVWAAIGLYLAYILKVGGDFMSGRFLTVPLFLAMILLVRLDPKQITNTALIVLYGAALALALSVEEPTLHILDHGPMKSGPIHVGSNGILDERLLYYGGTGLLNVERNKDLPDFYWAHNGEQAKNEGLKVVDKTGIGMFGYFAGPDVYVLDRLALADPLLARLPTWHKVNWRIGHMERIIPDGYRETLELQRNVIKDSNLALYYDKLSIITRGSLTDPKRLLEIWKMNTGQYDYLINKEMYQYPNLKHLALSKLGKEVENLTPCTASGLTALDDSGVEIDLEGLSHASNLEIGLDHDDKYRLSILFDQKVLATQDISTARLPDPGGISKRRVEIPPQVAAAGYNRLRILPLTDSAPYCLAYLILK